MRKRVGDGGGVEIGRVVEVPAFALFTADAHAGGGNADGESEDDVEGSGCVSLGLRWGWGWMYLETRYGADITRWVQANGERMLQCE